MDWGRLSYILKYLINFYMKYDYLIIWAWLTWLVIWERSTNQFWKKVLIIDKRNHIWWNCYDYKDKQTWITVHKYWPHVFHTKYKEVRDYLSQFTEWNPFFYNVKAIVDSNIVSLPFNLNSLYQVFSPELAKKYENLLIDKYWFWTRLVIKELLDSWDENLKFLFFPKRELFLKWKFFSIFNINIGTNTFRSTAIDSWLRNLQEESLQIFLSMYWNCIKSLFKILDEWKNNLYLTHRHMFIMKKELFLKYEKRLFDYLLKLELYIKEKQIDTYNYFRDNRFIWIFSEILINYWRLSEENINKTSSFDSNILMFE